MTYRILFYALIFDLFTSHQFVGLEEIMMKLIVFKRLVLEKEKYLDDRFTRCFVIRILSIAEHNLKADVECRCSHVQSARDE